MNRGVDFLWREMLTGRYDPNLRRLMFWDSHDGSCRFWQSNRYWKSPVWNPMSQLQLSTWRFSIPSWMNTLFGITGLRRLQELVLRIYRVWNNGGSHGGVIVPGWCPWSQQVVWNHDNELRDILWIEVTWVIGAEWNPSSNSVRSILELPSAWPHSGTMSENKYTSDLKRSNAPCLGLP